MNNSDELSMEIIVQYVKKGCKKCLGRGYRIVEVPKFKWGFRNAEPHLQTADYCDCVKKRMKKNVGQPFVD